MKVIIDINGEGTAKGAGEYFIGDTLTLQAIPEESVEFGYWLIADNETLKPEDRLKVSDNPFTIQVTPQITANGNMKVEAYFYMSMREYLKAQIDYELKNTSYISVAQKWGFRLSDDSRETSEMKKDLAYADLLLIVCTAPSTIQGKTKKAGNWSITDTSKTISINDKKRLEQRAKDLYAKWGLNLDVGTDVEITRLRW
jgi:hypothetical protein